MDESLGSGIGDTDIAIVGMAAHLPGAPDIATFWQNLAEGVSSIRILTEAELLAAGETPEMMALPNYVRAAATLEGFEGFDAEFFGFSPKEAAILDPQHRQFLEVAWEALENAGHPPEGFDGRIGVYAGCGMGSYFYFNLCSNPALVQETGLFLLRHTGNDKDFLATRVSHVFDLRGPSVNVQTACSTSLVAVHQAAQALLGGECDMALAGGVTVELPHGRGYLHQEGEILSPDGLCHAFDHRAEGTVFGSGAGCVVLRRARDAVRDGDHIWAIMKGSAINNDGAAKAGYLAPSVDGQAACVAEALAVAGVGAESVSYVECHGTGTRLGDPIEVAALTRAFRQTTQAVGHCRIGSVKTNIGHLDTAAGVASLIKVALSLHHRQIPPSLGFEAPNPAIDFASSPFTVNDRLTPWRAAVRRAGVNSLGVGGTNAHAILEEAPARTSSEPSIWPFHPLVLSARSRAALDAQAARLAAHLRDHPGVDLADVAYTLKEGRRAFDKRRVIVAASPDEAVGLLEGADNRRVFNHDHLGENPEVVFMFPGGGAQFAGMARDLYETEPVFADWMDRGLSILAPRIDHDIRALWLPPPGQEAEADAALKRPSVQLPLIMITEYALAKLYESWGVSPVQLIGHSMGENTAACLAGVMSFEDCIGLVHLRGRLFDRVEPGGMLSVPLAEAEVAPWLGEGLDLASVNAPGLCVVSGRDAALGALAARLADVGVETTRIAIDIAAHSRLLDPILDEFRAFLASIRLAEPRLPVISNRTGLALTEAQATDPGYWVSHLRETVNFREGIAHLAAGPRRVFVEMGPGRSLSALAQANGIAAGQVIAALRHPEQRMADDAWHVGTIARLWACGVAVDWGQIWAGARRNRVPLPGYAFQRKPYFIAPGAGAAPGTKASPDATALPPRIDDIADWGWEPHWRPEAAVFDIAELDEAPRRDWLIFLDEAGLGAAVAERLRRAGHGVSTVRAGDAYADLGQGAHVLAPERGREGYDALIRDLAARGPLPQRIAHFWLVTETETFRPGSSFRQRNLEQGFHSLVFLTQALAGEGDAQSPHISLISTGAAAFRDEGLRHPEKACALGPLRVIGRELVGASGSSLDIVLPPRGSHRGTGPLPADLVDRVLEELLQHPAPETRVAVLRGARRLVLGLKPRALPPATEGGIPEGAHVLITGGFGGMGLTLAEDLARRHGARLTLLARQLLPDPALWDSHLAAHGHTDPTSRRILGLRRLRALGARVEAAAADVCNPEEMRAAIDRAEAALGPVRVVIHAAGAMADGPLLTRTPAEIEDILGPKVHGTAVLDRLFPDGSLDLMVLFGSTSAVTGPAGQADYVAANEYLGAYAARRAGGRTRVLALMWGIWNGTGMAAEALSGRLGLPAPEAPPLPLTMPLLHEAGLDAQGNRRFTSHLDAGHWVLDGHRLRDGGRTILPGTGMVEMMLEAWRAQGEALPVEIRDLAFLAPLDLPADGGARETRLHLRRTAEGYAAELLSAHPLGPVRKGWLCHAEARLLPALGADPVTGLGQGVPAAPSLDLAAIRDRLSPPALPARADGPQGGHIAFGARWQVLRGVALGPTGEGLAELSLPPPFEGEAADAAGWLAHPALFDIATGWAMDLIPGYDPARLWVPVGYNRLRLWNALPAGVVSHVRLAAGGARGGGTARFDVTLATPAGEVCAEIEGLTLRELETTLPQAAPDPRILRHDPAPQDEGHSHDPATDRLLAAYSRGIRVAEGGEAFARALAAARGARIYVSSIDLAALVRATDATAARQAAPRSPGFERPTLESSYVAPRSETERRLSGIWKELLGLDEVGVEDSFFDLGGHSLIAVRLFAKIRRTFRVDFPISILFEAPTIAACARLIEAETEATRPDQSAPAPAASALHRGAAARGRFTHLVPMHDGEGGPAQPFFLVAGMFGNVLNLRHLAQLLGRDRPFWGLQARGLLGGETPHATLPEAAAACIAEMRQVQERGPWLIGGFSGGGLTAWEIAHQLEAAGEEVSLLALLDTPLPVRPPLSRGDRALIKAAELRRNGPRYLAEWARARWEWERHLRRGATADGGADAVPSAASFHNAAIEAAFRGAVACYDLPRRVGPTVLYRPPLDLRWKVAGGRWVSRAREYVLPDNGLAAYAPALEVVEVPGDHDSMVLEPNVRVLAARLRGALAATETRDTGDSAFGADAQPIPVARAAE